MNMRTGRFYYIEDQYFVDFPDDKLMRNKDRVGSKLHDRPCFYAFEDESTGLFWMIPCSSRVQKYKAYYEAKVARYGKCDTITFGEILGFEKAFLIQNMCPVTEKYIKNEYIDRRTSVPVRIDGRLEAELISKAKRVWSCSGKALDLSFRMY